MFSVVPNHVNCMWVSQLRQISHLLGDCDARKGVSCFLGGQDSSSDWVSAKHAAPGRLAEQMGTLQGSSGMSQLHWLPSQSASKWAEPGQSLIRAVRGRPPYRTQNQNV